MGKPIGQAKPFTEETVKRLKFLLRREGRLRDLCLFSVQTDACLRSSDVLTLTVADVRWSGGVKDEFLVKQKKTKYQQKCFLSEETRSVTAEYIARYRTADSAGCGWLFPGQSDNPLSGRQHRTLVKEWCHILRWSRVSINPADYSTHSMRRTLPSHIVAKSEYENCDIPLSAALALMDLLGHKSFESTRRYLNLDGRRARVLAEKFAL